MKLRSFQSLSFHLAASALVSTLFARPLYQEEELEKVNDQNVPQAPQQIVRPLSQEPLQSTKMLSLSFTARVEDDWELVQKLAKSSPGSRNLYPWEQPSNFARPFAKNGSSKGADRTRFRTLKRKSDDIRIYRGVR